MKGFDYQYDELMNPLLNALRALGGSGTNEEILSKIAENLKIPSAQLELLHNPEKGGMTEIEYRLMWTRTYLKRVGLIDNSTRGVWSLTEKGQQVTEIDPGEVVRTVRAEMKKAKGEPVSDDEPDHKIEWQEELLGVLLSMPPNSFERLIQRMLREAGFVQVEVTGQTGDGGIDGLGILRLGGMLSFHVMFQCKRWKGTVGAREIRDFRGAMVGRADKGLFITTGTFTKDAVKEATRDGATAIDLIEGDQLVEKLKQLGLGVKTEIIQIEKVTIQKEWFGFI
jgi:restriction system protein